VSARSHYFVNARGASDDYQEIDLSFAWLDRWTVGVAAIPNAVRWYDYQRLGRSPAWVAETSGQWLLAGGLFATAGAGYYYASAAGWEPAAGYVYGNAGCAFEYRSFRVEVGYYFAQQEAQEIFPYPAPRRHVAGTLSWRF
jgi:hypothetical protein